MILGFGHNTNWQKALRPRDVDPDGGDPDLDARHAEVVEVTGYPTIQKWLGLDDRPKDDLDFHYPPGTRVIVRREPLHPGAQQRMFDTNGWRHTIIICDLPGDSPLAVSYTHLRAHETVLDLVCRLLLEKKKHKT